MVDWVSSCHERWIWTGLSDAISELVSLWEQPVKAKTHIARNAILYFCIVCMFKPL
jgi:hypothetical protein